MLHSAYSEPTSVSCWARAPLEVIPALLCWRHANLAPRLNLGGWCPQEMMWANFYDNWVSRDIDGHLFSISAPHVTDAYSRQRLERGLHFPVKCCWNGMAVMNAAPFLRHGVRLRCAPEGSLQAP